MLLLVSGLILFSGVHLIPVFPVFRTGLVRQFTEAGYKILFSVLSTAGFILLIAGVMFAPHITLYAPAAALQWIPVIVMPFAFILLAGTYIPSNIKRFTRHPMLWSVTLWAASHLFANGDLAGVLLFGCFGLYAALDMYSANRRGAQLSARVMPWKHDLLVVIVGLAVYILTGYCHKALFGVSIPLF